MNTRLYCLRNPGNNWYLMWGADLWFVRELKGVPDLFNTVDPSGFRNVYIGDMWNGTGK